MSALYLTAKVSSQILYDMPSFYTSMIFALDRSYKETLFQHSFNNWAYFNDVKKRILFKKLYSLSFAQN